MSSNSTGKVIRSVNIGKKKVIVRLNDEVLKISHETYLDFKLYPNKELSDKEYKAIISRDKFDDAYQYAVSLISKNEYTEEKLTEKLLSKGYDKKNVSKIVKKLKESGLIDDDEYIRDYIEYANAKLFGEYRIKQGLLEKGIAKEKIDELKFKEKDEKRKINELSSLLEKKYASKATEAKKKSMYDALIRYGYDVELVKEVVENTTPTDEKIELKELKKDLKKAKAKYERKYEGYELKKKITESLLRKGYRYKDINNLMEEE